MKLFTCKRILTIYNLFLAIGAIWTGVLMIQSSSGIFTEFPKEWIGKLPFQNWVVPGIIVFMIFGLGNLAAVITGFLNNHNFLWITSAVMGVLLLSGIMLQGVILREWYLPDIYFCVFSMIQLLLSGIGYVHQRKKIAISGGILNE